MKGFRFKIIVHGIQLNEQWITFSCGERALFNSRCCSTSIRYKMEKASCSYALYLDALLITLQKVPIYIISTLSQ